MEETKALLKTLEGKDVFYIIGVLSYNLGTTEAKAKEYLRQLARIGFITQKKDKIYLAEGERDKVLDIPEKDKY